jgi:DNA polymerase-3 subunit gamma/tau
MPPAALARARRQYADGADPMAVLRDLAEVTHWISVIKITPEAADDPTSVPTTNGCAARTMAETLPVRVLTRMWQMLLKALEEVRQAPNAMMAAEMAVIRLTHVADLPSPEDLDCETRLQDARRPPPPPWHQRGRRGIRAGVRLCGDRSARRRQRHIARQSGGGGPRGQRRRWHRDWPGGPDRERARPLRHVRDVVALIRANRDGMLRYEVENFRPPRRLPAGPDRVGPHTEDAPRDLAEPLAGGSRKPGPGRAGG